MNDETIKEIIRAFASGVSIDIIAAHTELTKDELVQFADDYKEAIAQAMEHKKHYENRCRSPLATNK